MLRTYRWKHFAIFFVLGMSVLAGGLIDMSSAAPLQPDHIRRSRTGGAFVHDQLQVATGNEAEARKYYRDVVAEQMKFMTKDTIEGSAIKDMLVYFGYSAIEARDLHRASSEQMMALSEAGDILATFFFAPKINRVATPATVAEDFGWRKLVRFKARPGSPAEANGMASLFFLQNIFVKSAATPPAPEANLSFFNQAIVIRKSGSRPYSVAKRAMYFFAYDPLIKCSDNSGGVKDCEGGNTPAVIGGQFQSHGVLGFKLKATFDVRNPETEAQGKDFFYVPRSCEDCHGKSAANAKLNFLDTDHWLDRVKPNYGLADARFSQEDFTALTAPVLPDGGIDTTTERFTKAFAVIRAINLEIREQNTDAAVNQDVQSPANFPIRAANKWLELHDPAKPDANRHVPPFERGFGSQPWNPASEQDRTLVYYLNRYCYRCHSSIKYNVFEREAVLRVQGDIIDRVTELTDSKLWMPQDRVFPGLETSGGVAAPVDDLREFLDLLQKLQ